MKILVTNDDGCDAPGILALAAALQPLGELFVVAPAENCSGASSSLTLSGKLRVEEVRPRVFRLSGTPTDCVHLALTGELLEARPDIVASGVNDGENMGDDTIYSGTVAAAMEAALFGIPAFAFSMASKPVKHFETGAQVAADIIKIWQAKPLAKAPLLNVNIPDIAANELRGMRATRLGRRHIAEPAVRVWNEGARSDYEIGPAGAARDAGEETDFYAVENNLVSVTPLTVDLTHDRRVGEVREWLR